MITTAFWYSVTVPHHLIKCITKLSLTKMYKCIHHIKMIYKFKIFILIYSVYIQQLQKFHQGKRKLETR